MRRDELPHARCVVLIEACEESGSFDLPAYIEHLAPAHRRARRWSCASTRAARNYDQLWSTTSLRGLVIGTLEVSLLTEGVHSGDGTGVIAVERTASCASCSIARRQPYRRVKLEQLHDRRSRSSACDQAARTAQVIGDEVFSKFPLQPGVAPVTDRQHGADPEPHLAPGLAVTGADGWPAIGSAGNVLRPSTNLKLSIRIPPRVDPQVALAAVKETLEQDPPYGAKVSFTGATASAGWDAPAMSPWLERALDEASQRHFGKPAMYMGEGGTIPFMYMLGEKFPKAQFCITGVLGPGSNAHGPNEFLHVPTARRLTLCVAEILATHAAL